MSEVQELLIAISTAAPSLSSWCDQMHLDPLTVGELCTLLAAKLVEWLLRPNRWVDAETPVARLAVSNRAAQLRVKARCWVDRFAAPAGHSLQDGDLLLYVAPESPETPKNEPLCEVALSGPAA